MEKTLLRSMIFKRESDMDKIFLEVAKQQANKQTLRCKLRLLAAHNTTRATNFHVCCFYFLQHEN